MLLAERSALALAELGAAMLTEDDTAFLLTRQQSSCSRGGLGLRCPLADAADEAPDEAPDEAKLVLSPGRGGRDRVLAGGIAATPPRDLDGSAGTPHPSWSPRRAALRKQAAHSRSGSRLPLRTVQEASSPTDGLAASGDVAASG